MVESVQEARDLTFLNSLGCDASLGSVAVLLFQCLWPQIPQMEFLEVPPLLLPSQGSH